MKYMRGMTSCVLDVFHTLSLFVFFGLIPVQQNRCPKRLPFYRTIKVLHFSQQRFELNYGINFYFVLRKWSDFVFS